MNITQQPAPPRWRNETGEDPDDAGGMVDALTFGKCELSIDVAAVPTPVPAARPGTASGTTTGGQQRDRGQSSRIPVCRGNIQRGAKHQMLHASDACMGDSGYTNINNNT